MTRSPVERHLRMTGAWADARSELEVRRALRALARRDRVQVTIAELQDELDAMRRSLGLLEVADMRRWLAAIGLDLEDVEGDLEVRLLHGKLCRRLDARQVAAEFERQRIRFDRVRLKLIVAHERASAARIARRWRGGRGSADDRVLERRLGQDVESGWFVREELPEEAAIHVFRADPGEIVGPVQVGEDAYAVFLAEAVRPAKLDMEVERRLRAEMVLARADAWIHPDDPGRFVLR